MDCIRMWKFFSWGCNRRRGWQREYVKECIASLESEVGLGGLGTVGNVTRLCGRNGLR